MADEKKNEKTRSILDEWSEKIIKDIETPIEIFFLALFVIGVIAISSTSLIGPCGRVDDYGNTAFEHSREVNLTPGSIVITNTSIVADNVIIGENVCGVVDEINEDGFVEVKFLSKVPLESLGGDLEYRAINVAYGVVEFPLETAIFVNTSPPSDFIDPRVLSVVPTRGFTNFFRDIFLNKIYFAIALLFVFGIVLIHIGRTYKKKRKDFFNWHTKRSYYISVLNQDKQKTNELKKEWLDIQTLLQTEDTSNWKSGLMNLEKLTFYLLESLRFKGDSIEAKLETMSEEDLWCIANLLAAQSFLSKVNRPDSKLAVSSRVLKNLNASFRESFTWLGFLEYE